MTKVERTPHVLSRLGDRHPAALSGVRAIPSAWEDEEHRLIGLLEECLRKSQSGLVTAAYELHLRAISGKGEAAKVQADLETRCRALHRALDDVR